MMILMNGHSLTPKDAFQPERLAVNLSERQSTATLTVSDEAPEIALDDWMQIENGPGAGIVWRVKTIDDQIDRRTRTITLEHTIQTLRDRIMFGEIKSSTISGSSANPTAQQAVQYILGNQSDWTLGGIAYSVSNPYSFNGDDLFSALETVSSSLADCIWEYDFSSYPFKLYIRQMSGDVDSEMRTDRNIRTMKRTIDRSRMYTRLYPIGKNNLHIDGDYVSLNENIYGIVSKVETDQSKASKAELLRWANERIARHAEPAVTVTISGLELAEKTGESLDSFTIGRNCRVPLPEYATTITERVKKLSYPDVISDPEDVTITLANELQDVATILKEQAASGGRGGRAGAKNAEEDHAWFVDTTDKVAMVAEAVAGKDGSGDPNWSRVAQLTVDGSGIDARVTYAEGVIVTQASRITQTEKAITAEVTRATGAESTMSSRITQTADAISAEVTRATGAESGLNGKINVEAGRIGLVVEGSGSGATVKRASIIAAINEDSSSTVTIKADKVDLGAYVLASTLDTNWIKTQIENAGLISVGTLQIANGTTPYGSANYVNILSLTRKYRVVEVTDGNNNVTGYKLQYTNLLNGATWVDCESGDQSVNFSRATSLGGSWSGDIYTITASPQGNSKSIGFSGNPGTNHVRLTVVQDSGTPTSSSTNEKYIDVPVKVTQSNPNAASTDRFTTTLQNVNATAAWNKGFSAGAPTAATLGSKVTGTTWNVSIARGSYAAVGKTIDLASAYTDARSGYYTKQQYNDNWTTGFNAGVPTGATLGSKVTGTTWNVSIARGSYAAVAKTIDLASAYTDARSGYYTKAQYDAALATVPAGYFNSAVVAFAPTAHDGAGLNDGELVNPGVLRATAKNGSTQLGYNDTNLYIGNSSWSSGKMTVAIRLAASNGKVISRKEFTMPASPDKWTWESATTSTWKVTCKVNGKEYTSTHSKT